MKNVSLKNLYNNKKKQKNIKRHGSILKHRENTMVKTSADANEQTDQNKRRIQILVKEDGQQKPACQMALVSL